MNARDLTDDGNHPATSWFMSRLAFGMEGQCPTYDARLIEVPSSSLSCDMQQSRGTAWVASRSPSSCEGLFHSTTQLLREVVRNESVRCQYMDYHRRVVKREYFYMYCVLMAVFTSDRGVNV